MKIQSDTNLIYKFFTGLICAWYSRRQRKWESRWRFWIGFDFFLNNKEEEDEYSIVNHFKTDEKQWPKISHLQGLNQNEQVQLLLQEPEDKEQKKKLENQKKLEESMQRMELENEVEQDRTGQDRACSIL